ncbi:MAG: Mobile element protein, partial [Olavius algarvensis Gamma 1 endosymbiont]
RSLPTASAPPASATRPAPTPSIESAPITVSSIASSSPGPHKP